MLVIVTLLCGQDVCNHLDIKQQRLVPGTEVGLQSGND